MKLKDALISWSKDHDDLDEANEPRIKLRVTEKALGVPPDAINFIDPDLWKQSNPAHLLLFWFSMFVGGDYGYIHMHIPRMDPQQVCYDFLGSRSSRT